MRDLLFARPRTYKDQDIVPDVKIPSLESKSGGMDIQDERPAFRSEVLFARRNPFKPTFQEGSETALIMDDELLARKMLINTGTTTMQTKPNYFS